MAYTIEHHRELPAIIGTWHKNFVFNDEGKQFSLEIHAALEKQMSPVYYVLDLSRWDDMSFDELMDAANMATRGPNANFHHPMNLGNVFITKDPAVQATAEGVQGELFGNAKVMIFPSLDDALSYIYHHR